MQNRREAAAATSQGMHGHVVAAAGSKCLSLLLQRSPDTSRGLTSYVDALSTLMHTYNGASAELQVASAGPGIRVWRMLGEAVQA